MIQFSLFADSMTRSQQSYKAGLRSPSNICEPCVRLGMRGDPLVKWVEKEYRQQRHIWRFDAAWRVYGAHQLAAILLLKQRLGLSFREVELLLRQREDLRAVLELPSAPDAATLWYFCRNLRSGARVPRRPTVRRRHTPVDAVRFRLDRCALPLRHVAACTGIDDHHLGRFLRREAGLSDRNLEKLSKILPPINANSSDCISSNH